MTGGFEALGTEGLFARDLMDLFKAEGASFFPISIRRGKRPLGSWKEFMERRPKESEIEVWKKKSLDGIGVVNGKISQNLCVLDIDNPQLYEFFKDRNTLTLRTPSGGYHLYFYVEEETHRRTKYLGYPIDILGDGGYTAIGEGYNVIIAVLPQKIKSLTGLVEECLPKVEYGDIPDDRKRFFSKAKVEAFKNNLNFEDVLSHCQIIPEGTGKNKMAKCPFHDDTHPSMIVNSDTVYCFSCKKGWDAIGLVMETYNCRFWEAINKLEGVFGVSYETEHKKVGGLAPEKAGERNNEVLDLIRNEIIEVFLDQFGTAYATVNVGNHTEMIGIRSQRFKAFATYLVWKQKRGVLNRDLLATLLLILEAEASEGKPKNLNNRVGRLDDKILYDLTSCGGKYVEISASGWRVGEGLSGFFRNYAHQLPVEVVPSPDKSGALDHILDLINLKTPEDLLLLKVYCVCLLVPDIPHTILMLHGVKGSAKSTAFRIIRQLLDPSKTPLLTLPKEAELVQQLDHNYLAFYDNVSALSRKQSDALCRAATGDGMSKRKLYTDDEDVIYSYQRCVGVNGINLPAKESDLLDRGLIIEFKRIRNRRKESDIWRTFEAFAPMARAEVFIILSKAMAIKEDLDIQNLPRMADSCEWGEAIAQAFGEHPRVYYNTFMRRVKRLSEEAVAMSLVGQAIQELMKNSDMFEDAPTKLLEDLNEIAFDLKIQGHKDWPKAPNSLTRKINLILSDLEDLDIKVTMAKSGDRKIKIEKVSLEPSNRPELE